MIRVLVVDDSAVARELICHILAADPELEVIGTARGGREALALLEHVNPDVITMDVHMQGMDGFEAAHRIMSEHPLPVVIVTGILDPTADSALFRTLEAGALAILLKPPGPGHPDHLRAAAELVTTVKLMSEVRVVRRSHLLGRHRPQPVERQLPYVPIRAVAIGASTGGPVVIHGILNALPADYPVPVLVVQHMAEEFINGFAEWLNASCLLTVKVGSQGEAILPGRAYVAPGGWQMGVDGEGRIRLLPGRPGDYLCPSVTHLFESLARSFGAQAVGVLLTGMGADGASGLKEMEQRGALTIAQDEESCVVYGMPGEAVKLGAARQVLDPAAIIALLQAVVRKGRREGV